MPVTAIPVFFCNRTASRRIQIRETAAFSWRQNQNALMQKSILSLVAALAILPAMPSRAADPASVAPNPAGPGWFGGDGPVRHALRTALQRMLAFRNETPLSAEQRKQVQGILEKHHDEIRAQFTAGRDAREALHTAIVDGSDAEAAAVRVGENARAGALLHAKLAREIRPVLTEEQRRRLDSAFDELQAGIGKVATVR